MKMNQNPHILPMNQNPAVLPLQMSISLPPFLHITEGLPHPSSIGDIPCMLVEFFESFAAAIGLACCWMFHFIASLLSFLNRVPQSSDSSTSSPGRASSLSSSSSSEDICAMHSGQPRGRLHTIFHNFLSSSYLDTDTRQTYCLRASPDPGYVCAFSFTC